MVGGRWVNEVLVGGSVVDFGGRLLVVDGSVEDLSVGGGWLLVIGGLPVVCAFVIWSSVLI